MIENGLIRSSQETISASRIEQMLRETIVETNSRPDSTSFLPYWRMIDGNPGVLAIRRSLEDDGREAFMLDVGVFNSKTDQIYSVCYADIVEIQDEFVSNRRIGILSVARLKTKDMDSRISRVGLLGAEGIKVAEAQRRIGLGRSIISSARVLLNEAGIDDLLIKNIRTEESPGRDFYLNLEAAGGVRLEEPQMIPGCGQIGKRTHMYFPTDSTLEALYRF